MRAVVMNGGALRLVSATWHTGTGPAVKAVQARLPLPKPRIRGFRPLYKVIEIGNSRFRLGGWQERVAVAVRCEVRLGAHGAAKQMTRKEIKLALQQMEDRGAYSLRVFLDNRTTVLAHQWYLEDAEETGEEGKKGEEGGEGDDMAEGLLRVVTRGRQALIAIGRIVLIEMVPPAA
jgi:hypothetical protein